MKTWEREGRNQGQVGKKLIQETAKKMNEMKNEKFLTGICAEICENATLGLGGLMPSMMVSFVTSDCRRSGRLLWNFPIDKLSIKFSENSSRWISLPWESQRGRVVVPHSADSPAFYKNPQVRHSRRQALESKSLRSSPPALALASTGQSSSWGTCGTSLWHCRCVAQAIVRCRFAASQPYRRSSFDFALVLDLWWWERALETPTPSVPIELWGFVAGWHSPKTSSHILCFRMVRSTVGKNVSGRFKYENPMRIAVSTCTKKEKVS